MNGMRDSNAKHIDFGFLQGCIKDNPKAMPSDLDMILERKGRFLVAEWKRTGEKLSIGQKIMLRELSLNAYFSVIVIEGYSLSNSTEVKDIYFFRNGKLEKTNYKGIDGLKDFINRWYKWADEFV